MNIIKTLEKQFKEELQKQKQNTKLGMLKLDNDIEAIIKQLIPQLRSDFYSRADIQNAFTEVKKSEDRIVKRLEILENSQRFDRSQEAFSK